LCTACQIVAWFFVLKPSCNDFVLSVLGVRAFAFHNPFNSHCCKSQGSRPFAGTMRMVCEFLRRKEVIQPQVPLRLPCYDFIPVTSYTLGLYPLAVGTSTSGATGFHDVTGGVYKTRERIHGAVDDAPLLAIPTSWRRVAASNPN
jgi:hypothetical protein